MKLISAFCLSIFLCSCSDLPEKNIHTEIVINSSPSEVWNVLADNSSYPSWNPYHVQVEGTLKVGETLDVYINKPNGEEIHVRPVVMELVPNRLLVWGGGVSGIFKGVHTFELQEIASSKTRLIHKETFRGAAIPFASLDAIDEGYTLMNKALKEEAEKGETHEN